jgi:hypothetical protein
MFTIDIRVLVCYTSVKQLNITSGQGEIPDRRYSPRAIWLTWCNSKTDSKVWMEEVDGYL